MGERYRGDLRRLRDEAARDPARELLEECKGIGDVGVDIFFREVQGEWQEPRPFLGERALRSAGRLDLPADFKRLAKLAGDSPFDTVRPAPRACAPSWPATTTRSATERRRSRTYPPGGRPGRPALKCHQSRCDPAVCSGPVSLSCAQLRCKSPFRDTSGDTASPRKAPDRRAASSAPGRWWT